jgi:GH35 family endo-1,4-beta-xylanase
MNELGKEISKNLLCDDPEVDFRIGNGIEANRKGFANLELKSADGQPVERAQIDYRQLDHEYRFGCNAFMLEQFPEAEQNARYEEMFADLFNLAVVPFYWSDLEPEDGKPRFAKDSPNVYRRPAPDLVLEFCQRHNITPKGHLLCWHEFVPDWVPADRGELEIRLERRVREIAERYAGKINIWDVTNEAIQWNPAYGATMPDSHVEAAFRMAEKYFPESTELLYNDGPWVSWDSYHGDYTPLYMLARHLLQQGLPMRGLGLQYHMFGQPAKMPAWNRQFCNQRLILDNLDQYAKLGVPLNVSEITITGHRDLGDGDEFQERVAEKLYRLWFSHAATNGIIWWNLVDGTAAYAPIGSEEGENKYRGGLLNYDFSPKPAFTALRRLIKEEWTTSGSLAYEQGTANQFRGFYGKYEVTVKSDAGTSTHQIDLGQRAKNRFVLNV